MYSTTPPNDQSGMTDLAEYLICKEVVSSGLLKFDDRPENYWAWKASFANSTIDLNLSAQEEMDLLTKWLGPQSTEKAKRIRAVHIYNVSLGLQMVWRRLEESYGSAEMIENSVDDIRRISKDHKQGQPEAPRTGRHIAGPGFSIERRILTWAILP